MYFENIWNSRTFIIIRLKQTNTVDIKSSVWKSTQNLLYNEQFDIDTVNMTNVTKVLQNKQTFTTRRYIKKIVYSIINSDWS